MIPIDYTAKQKLTKVCAQQNLAKENQAVIIHSNLFPNQKQFIVKKH
jgi:hypothetical protein